MNILTTIAIILVVMWMLGLGFHVTAGGLIHLLLVLAAATILIRIIMGRRVL